MKANRPLPLRALFTAAALAALVAGCATPPPPPPPRPAPRPQPSYTPPPPAPRPSADWRDAPYTPGTWRWSLFGGASSARFAESASGAALEFRCDRRTGAVLLLRSGVASGPVPLVVTTTSTARTLTAQPLGGPGAGPSPALVVALPARDPLLDAIIFSRGRFAVEARGFAPIFAPTWPEIARVVEDCR